MASLRELGIQNGQNQTNVSMRALAGSHGATSLQATAISQSFRTYHLSRGGAFGALGRERGNIKLTSDGGYRQDYQLGAVKLVAGQPKEVESVDALVEFMGLECFNVNDPVVPIVTPHPHDEPYVIISIILLNPSLLGKDELVKTVKLQLDSVRPGEVVGSPTTIYHGPVPGVTGLLIAAFVFEEDQGNPKVVRDAIHDALLKLANDAGSAIGAALGAGAGAGDAFANNELTKWTARILSHGLTEALGVADDKIGQKTMEIAPSRIAELSDQAIFNRSLVAGVLPDGRKFNYPIDYKQHISGNSARYQVYFRVRGDRNPHHVPEITAA